MIKKFVSNALLSVVMDKDARKKLKNMRTPGSAETPRPATKKPAPEKRRASQNKPLAADSGSESGEDVIDTIAQALAEARAEVAESPGTRGRQKASTARNTRGKPAASPSPSSPSPPSPSPPRPSSPPAPSPQKRASTPERERLIQEALSIQRQKSHVLEELDPAMREKLMVMAQYVMDPSSLPPSARKQAKTDARSEGLVDNLGTKAGSARKKPLPPRK